jgi:hypothetical protein
LDLVISVTKHGFLKDIMSQTVTPVFAVFARSHILLENFFSPSLGSLIPSHACQLTLFDYQQEYSPNHLMELGVDLAAIVK